MAYLLQLVTSFLLFLSIPFGIYIGKNFSGNDLPIFVGLLLQFIIGNIILIYTRGYVEQKKKLSKIYFGYLLFFLGVIGSFFSGKTVWLLFFWEISTFGSIFLFSEGNFGEKEIRSIIALFGVSGISLVFLAAWVFLPDGEIGLRFLLVGLLMKGGFSGMHFWLPEEQAGAPAHASAAFSGLYINLPILLFVRYVLPDWNLVGWDIPLILFAGVGVFFGGVTAFFNNNVRRALAYSTIEMMNFMWLSLFVGAYWWKGENTQTSLIGKGFLVLFYITLIHHSLSKSFQFLAFGYLCKLSGSTISDSNKGYGRISGISSAVLGIGTFSFGGLPGSIGFISETTFLFLSSQIIDLPFGRSIFILPALIFIVFGIVLGGAAHVKLYLPLVLSLPDENIPLKKAPGMVSNSLKLLGILIFASPLILFAVYHGFKDVFHTPQNLVKWLDTLFIVSTLMSIFYLSLIFFRWSHRVKERRIWDCGNRYQGSDLSIHSSVISDPLHNSIGRYFNNYRGYSKIDDKLFAIIHQILDLGRFWIARVESGAASNYLAFSAFCLILSIAILFTFQNF